MFGFRKKKTAIIEPTKPISFGWKTGWFSFACEIEHVLETLTKKYEPLTWESAIEDYLKGRKPFVAETPTRWTILCTTSDAIIDDLNILSQKLDCDVAYFESHRVVGGAAYGWTENGEVVRVHAQVDGELLEEFGEISDIEAELGIWPIDFNDDTELTLEEEDERWCSNPDEESVLQIAAEVAFDPSEFEHCGPSVPFGVKLKSWR